jgi:transcriptional regulator with XRE-family HTH domain
VQLKTVKEYSEEIAQRAKQVRQQAKLTQAELAEQAGLPLSTYKRFEQKGLIAFDSLIQVPIALRCEHSLDALFASMHPRI